METTRPGRLLTKRDRPQSGLGVPCYESQPDGVICDEIRPGCEDCDKAGPQPEDSSQR
jgi:hypothetical protein